MAEGNSISFDGTLLLEDARISDRNTISVPATVLKRLKVGPRDYLRFLENEDGHLTVEGMALRPIRGSELAQVADERVLGIKKGESLTLDEIRRK